MADKVTYKYYLGRKAMFDSDLSLCMFVFALVVEKKKDFEKHVCSFVS